MIHGGAMNEYYLENSLPPPADLNETTSAMNGNREFSEFSETGIFFINHGQNRKDWL